MTATLRLRHYPANKTDGPFNLTGAQWSRLSKRRQTQYVEQAFRYWRKKGFPYYRLTSSQMISELSHLSAVDVRTIFTNGTIRGTNAGVRLASSFHPRIWSVRVSRYMSPMDCFCDDGYLKAAIRRAFAIWPDRHGANASCLRRILKSFSNCAAVSNFRPAVARAVIEKFSRENDVVLDFAAGYGGRLLGCLSLPRHYIGFEPCTCQVRGLNRCTEAVQELGLTPGTAEIRQGCAEDLLPKVRSRSIRLVFSSPPYFDWEKYSSHKTQSFMRYKTYSEWRERFLRRIVFESHRILTPDGYLAVNVPNGNSRLSLLEDLTGAAKAAGFKLHRIYRLRLSKVPYLHPRSGRSKWEAIAVFRKQRISQSGHFEEN